VPPAAAAPRRRGLPVAAAALLTAGALAAGTVLGWTARRTADRAEQTVAAPARELLDDVRAPAAGAPVTAAGAAPRLVVVDRRGRLVRELPAQRPWTPRFSPDGGRVAYGAFARGRDGSELWVADLGAGTAERLTSDGRDGNDPQWSPDGRRLAYSAAADGGKDVFVRAVDGGDGAVAAALPPRDGDQFPTDWLPDGSGVLVTEQAGGALDVLVQPTDGGPARPYAATGARESGARVSPDGRWVAYGSDETGGREVYVDGFPAPGRRLRVSAGGGEHPVWGRDGRTLYYWQGDLLVAARVEPGVGGGRRRSARARCSSGRRTRGA
jgi:Tol biopolymer transport system component